MKAERLYPSSPSSIDPAEVAFSPDPPPEVEAEPAAIETKPPVGKVVARRTPSGAVLCFAIRFPDGKFYNGNFGTEQAAMKRLAELEAAR